MELSRVLYGIESLKFRHKGLSNVVGIIIILPTIFYTTHKWAKTKLMKIISTYSNLTHHKVKCVWKTKADKLRTNLFLALYKKSLKVFRLKAAILGLKFVNLVMFNCSLLCKTCLNVYSPVTPSGAQRSN